MGRIIICSTPNVISFCNPRDISYQGDISTTVLLSKTDPKVILDPDDPTISTNDYSELLQTITKKMAKSIKVRYRDILQYNLIIVSNLRTQVMLIPRYSQTDSRICPDAEMFATGSIESAPANLD